MDDLPRKPNKAAPGDGHRGGIPWNRGVAFRWPRL